MIFFKIFRLVRHPVALKVSVLKSTPSTVKKDRFLRGNLLNHSVFTLLQSSLYLHSPCVITLNEFLFSPEEYVCLTTSLIICSLFIRLNTVASVFLPVHLSVTAQSADSAGFLAKVWTNGCQIDSFPPAIFAINACPPHYRSRLASPRT